MEDIAKHVYDWLDVMTKNERMHDIHRRMASVTIAKISSLRSAIAHLTRERDEAMSENRKLRKWMAFRYAGERLYRDDGELQDNGDYPFIDFKCDSVSNILDKMAQRAKRAAEAAKEADDA